MLGIEKIENIQLLSEKLEYCIDVCVFKVETRTVSTPGYLNRFRSGFTLISIMWTGKSMQIRLFWIGRLS